MKQVGNEKLSQRDIDTNFLIACNRGNVEEVVKYVELYKANINCMDPRGYGRALMYALKGCSGKESKGETIVRYLISKGADINFKHGDKGRDNDYKPYFAYWAIDGRANVSDDLVEFIIKHSSKQAIYEKPEVYSNGMSYSSVYDKLQKDRPELFKKLVSNKVLEKPQKVITR